MAGGIALARKSNTVRMRVLARISRCAVSQTGKDGIGRSGNKRCRLASASPIQVAAMPVPTRRATRESRRDVRQASETATLPPDTAKMLMDRRFQTGYGEEPQIAGLSDRS